MRGRIPNLWRLKEDAARLYQLYIFSLQRNCLYDRVIYACRRIRRYAAHGPGREKGLFTFSFEIDALCDLKEYKTAWRQLRLRDEIIFGKRLDIKDRHWSADDSRELAFSYAPLLFFMGRYRQGCLLLETSLRFWFDKKNVRSYDILFYVFNGDREPRHRCRVTLSHFYDRLGNDLRQWQYWEAFVRGFHPRLLSLSDIGREDLLSDPGNLSVLFDRLMAVRA